MYPQRDYLGRAQVQQQRKSKMRFDLLRGPCAGPIRENAEAVDIKLSALLQGQRAQEAVLQALPATGSVAEQ